MHKKNLVLSQGVHLQKVIPEKYKILTILQDFSSEGVHFQERAALSHTEAEIIALTSAVRNV